MLSSSTPVCATTVQTLDHLELLRDPNTVLETLDVAGVSAQGPVHGGAVRADQNAPGDGGPARVRGPAVCTHGHRGPGLGLGEHPGDLQGSGVKTWTRDLYSVTVTRLLQLMIQLVNNFCYICFFLRINRHLKLIIMNALNHPMVAQFLKTISLIECVSSF